MVQPGPLELAQIYWSMKNRQTAKNLPPHLHQKTLAIVPMLGTHHVENIGRHGH